METIDKVFSTSLNTYFNILNSTGFVKDTELCKLVFLSFVSELPEGYMSIYLTDEDVRLIQRVLYNIYGTNIIPMPIVRKNVYIANNSDIYTQIRITQNGDIRSTGNSMRLVDQ